jgi:hypothetical protein
MILHPDELKLPVTPKAQCYLDLETIDIFQEGISSLLDYSSKDEFNEKTLIRLGFALEELKQKLQTRIAKEKKEDK